MSESESVPVSAAPVFDFTLTLSGPSNMGRLAQMMKERNIENDDKLEFTQDFVAQFYNDHDQTPGKECMFNGEPSVWGALVWDHLHLLTYYYPVTPSDDVKRAAYQHVHALRYLLPCEHCRAGFRKEILETPVEEFLESRESFIEWGITVHTNVSKRLGKPDFDADATFERLLAPKIRDSQTTKVASKTTTTTTTAKTTTQASSNTSAVNRNNVGTQKDSTKQVASQKSTLAVANHVTFANRTNAASQDTFVAQRSSYTNRSAASIAATSQNTVRDALRRNTKNLTLQQKANLQKQSLAQKAKGIKEPGECKSCGSKKPLTPSVF